jgi:sodium transport system permease protein
VSISSLKGSDVFATLGLSVSVFVLAGPLLAGLGIAGIVITQIAAFALPTLLVAATREEGWRLIGWRPSRALTLFAAAGIGGTLWIWNAMWIAPIGEDWASTEQIEALTRVFAVHERSILLNLLVFALLPAVCEELLHRGVIAPALARRLGFWAGLVLSSLLFGFFHFNLARLLPTTLLGMAAGFVRLRSGSLAPAILLHFVYNAGLLIASRSGLEFSTLLPLASVVGTTIFVFVAYKSMQSKKIPVS